MTRIKLIQNKLQLKRRRNKDWQLLRLKIMVVSRNLIKLITTRLLRRDKPNWQEFQQPLRNLKLLILKDWQPSRRDFFLSRRQRKVLQINSSEVKLKAMKNHLSSSIVKRSISYTEPVLEKFFMEEQLLTELRISSKNFAKIYPLIAILSRSRRWLTICNSCTIKS